MKKNFFLDVSVTPLLSGFKKHSHVPSLSGRVLAGVSRVLIFSVLRAVIMQTLQGAREVLTASSYRRQSQPFMSFSVGSGANETAPLVQLVCCPRPRSTQGAGGHCLVKGPCEQSCMKHNSVKHL